MKFICWMLAVFVVALSIAAAVSACGPRAGQVVRARPNSMQRDRALTAAAFTDAECKDVLERQYRAGTVAKVAAAVGGSGGVAAIVPRGESDLDQGVRYVGGGLAIVAASVSAGAIFAAERRADEFSKYCEVVDVKDATASSEEVADHVADVGNMKSELASNPFEDGGVE